MYDWDDSGQGDNRGAPEHVGMVEAVDQTRGTMTIIEGNMGSGSVVGRRTVPIGGRYIRGYCCPDYASKADKPPVADPEPKEPWYAGAQTWATEMGLTDGSRPEDDCTRAEVWAMLRRYHEAAGAARGGE